MSNENVQSNPILESRKLQEDNLLKMTIIDTVILNGSNDGNLNNQIIGNNGDSKFQNFQNNGNQINRTINNDNHNYHVNKINESQSKSKDKDKIQYVNLGEESIKRLNKDGNYIYDIDMNNETEQSFNKKLENVNKNIGVGEGNGLIFSDNQFSSQIINSTDSFKLIKSDIPLNVNNTQNNNNINNEPINISAQLNKNQQSAQNTNPYHKRDDSALRFIYNPIAPRNGSVVLVKPSDKNINKFKLPNPINDKKNISQYENEAKNREKLLQLIPNGTIESKISEQNIQDNNINLPDIGESIFENKTIESVYA